VALLQRDAVGRLARREFPMISDEMAYRFRDVYDHLVRITDEGLIFQDRVTGIIEAHLSNVSNRLNEVMKVLTVIATSSCRLTVLTGICMA
jgi:magnesium transporter